jgi:hypothetical protein
MMDSRGCCENFHLPLPEGTYAELRAEAERAQIPATTIAREAISEWLRARKKAARRRAVMEYAANMAGTRFDLDPRVESAAVEELMRMDLDGM